MNPLNEHEQYRMGDDIFIGISVAFMISAINNV